MLLLEKQLASSDCVLIINEMYLQKYVQYHSGDFVGKDEGNLYKGIVFMIVSFKKSVPIAIRALSDTSITGERLKSEINKCIFDLMEVGFKVRAAIAGDHPSNANAF